MKGVDPKDYPLRADRDAARHLAMIARRYQNDRATIDEVRDALRVWAMAVRPAVLLGAPPALLKASRAAYDMLCIAVDTNGGDSKTHIGCENLRKALANAEGRSV